MLAGWSDALGGMALSFIVAMAFLEWLYPKKLRVFVVEDADANLDMRDAPRLFFFQVRPGRWIAVQSDAYGEKKEIERDLRELFEGKK